MSTWSYRVIKHDETPDIGLWFGLHEVYYNKKDNIDSWSLEPIVTGDSVEDIEHQLGNMVIDLKRYREILTMSEIIGSH